LFLSDGSSVSVNLPAPSTLLNLAFHKNFRLREDSKLNESVVDNRIFTASTVDSSQREHDNFSRAKSPIVAAFLTPLTASISVVRQSVESGVRRCSDAANANPLFHPKRKASSEAEAAFLTNPTQDPGHCERHVVRRRVSINARCGSIPCTPRGRFSKNCDTSSWHDGDTLAWCRSALASPRDHRPCREHIPQHANSNTASRAPRTTPSHRPPRSVSNMHIYGAMARFMYANNIFDS
jgi:hypothetical protein